MPLPLADLPLSTARLRAVKAWTGPSARSALGTAAGRAETLRVARAATAANLVKCILRSEG